MAHSITGLLPFVFFLLLMLIPESRELTKVGFLLNADLSHSWTLQHEIARANLGRQLSDKILTTRTIQPDEFNYDKVKSNILNFIKTGHPLIFSTSSGFEKVVKDLCKIYTNVSFVHVPGADSVRINYIGVQPQWHQPFYIFGYVAALYTKTKVIGAITIDDLTIRNPLNALYLGMKAVDPTVVLKVIYVTSWSDERTYTQATEQLVTEENADILVAPGGAVYPCMWVAQNPSYGATCFGYSDDFRVFLGDSVLTSELFGWEGTYHDIILNFLNGSFVGRAISTGLETGLAGIAPFSNLVPDPIVKNATKVLNKLVANIISNPNKEWILCGSEFAPYYPEDGDCLSPTQVASFNFLLNEIQIVQGKFYFSKIEIGNVTITLVLTLSIICLVLVALYFLLAMLKVTTPVMVASSTPFTFMMFVGALLSVIAPFFYVTSPAPLTCMAGDWLSSYGFCVIFSCLIVKNWRLYHIKEAVTKTLKMVVISNYQLLPVVGGVVVVMTVILITWQLYPKAVLVPTYIERPSLQPDERYYICYGTEYYYFVIAINVVKFCLLIAALVLAWVTRQVSSLFNESSMIAISVYSMATMEIVVLPLIYTAPVEDHDTTVLLLSLLSLFRGIMPISFIMLPKFWIAYVRTDKNETTSLFVAKTKNPTSTTGDNTLEHTSGQQ